MTEPTRDDLIYLACTIDMEGSIGAYAFRNKKLPNPQEKYALHVKITNTNPMLAVWLHDLFAFNVFQRPQTGNRKECWDCYMSSDKAVKLLTAVQPFLKLKQGQAAILIAMRRIQKLKGHNHPALPALKAKLTELNKRGVA